MFSTAPGGKTMVIADLHGELSSLLYYREKVFFDSCIIAGDLGYGLNQELDKYFQRELKDIPAKIFFIDGNHDNTEKLMKEGCSSLSALTWLKRGSLFTDGLGRQWLCVGGAECVDRDIRKKNGLYWSATETLTAEQINNILPEIEDAEIYGVISHEAPVQFSVPGIDTMPQDVREKQFRTMGWNIPSGATRANLRRIFRQCKPRRWLFGHYHKNAKGIFEDCAWIALPPGDSPVMLELL